MKCTVHRMEQQTPPWYLIRIGKCTMSNAEKAKAKAKDGGPGVTARRYLAKIRAQIKLLKRIHAGHIEWAEAMEQFDFKTRAMDDGNTYEILAIQEYEDRTGSQVERVGFIEFADHPIGCSPDGLVGTDGMIEVKCPNSDTHEMYTGEGVLPAEYKWQVQGQMWVAKRTWCDFCSYDFRLDDLFVVRVVRTPLQRMLMMWVQ